MELTINEQLLNKEIAKHYNNLQQIFKCQNTTRNECEIGSKYWCQSDTRLNITSAAIKTLEKIQALEDIRYKEIQFNKFCNRLKEIAHQEHKGSVEHQKYAKSKSYYMGDA